MKISREFKKSLLAILFAVSASNLSHATEIESIHFLIPGSAGGGWDGTARGTGEVLTESGLIGKASYENMSGGGGGKALGYFVENAASLDDTLMVQSTPIIVRSLMKRFPQNFRDLTPIASVIGDYAAFVVKADSPYQSFAEIVEAYGQDPSNVSFAGGSAPGATDHIVTVKAFKVAGAKEPQSLSYLAFDSGGPAMASLLSGEADFLTTGLSEAITFANAGEVRILAYTASERLDELGDTPTLKDQGVNLEFYNWRGFFAPPGTSDEKKQAYIDVLQKMYDTPEWEVVRERNGWVNIFNSGDDFIDFLTLQEEELGELMKEMGFL